jgi:hypothetical protein
MLLSQADRHLLRATSTAGGGRRRGATAAAAQLYSMCTEESDDRAKSYDQIIHYSLEDMSTSLRSTEGIE